MTQTTFFILVYLASLVLCLAAGYITNWEDLHTGGDFICPLFNDYDGRPWNICIWLPFLICFALKTAQGSSTVAIITTASIIAPLMGVMGFVTPIEKAVLVTALCAGAMSLSHVNDSFFWVVTQMSGMNVKTGFKIHTLASLLGGLSAMLSVCIIHAIFC